MNKFNIKKTLNKLFEQRVDIQKFFNPKTKIEISDIEPTEKEKSVSPEISSSFSSLRNELFMTQHKLLIYWMSYLEHNYDIPSDVKKEWNEKIKNIKHPKDLQDEELKRKYLLWVQTFYNLFKKYLAWKKKIKEKEIQLKIKKINIRTIKAMIANGKNLQEIADSFRIPKSTLSFWLKKLYKTSFTKLKQETRPQR